MSRHFGSGILWLVARGRLRAGLDSVRGHVAASRRDGTLPYYLIGARLAPVVPGWLLNVAAAHSGVPLDAFFVSCVVGIIPYSYVTCMVGTVLKEIDPLDPAAVLSGSSGMKLLLIALAMLSYPVILRRLKNKNPKPPAPAPAKRD